MLNMKKRKHLRKLDGPANEHGVSKAAKQPRTER
jgi:hypothetical protein